MTLDEQWRDLKCKRDKAAVLLGRNSKVTKAYERDLKQVTERRLRRDMRRKKAA